MMREKLTKAIALRTQQRFEEARALFTELHSAFPDDAEINYHFAWLHDSMGEERAAVPYYERAITGGLPEEDLRGAMLGLGSTYRTLGEYQKSADLLQRGVERFPDGDEFRVFLAMALYNLAKPAAAMELLLKVAAETSNSEYVRRFQRAILFYADKLDETWN